MKDKNHKKENLKKSKDWGNGGGLYRGVKANVKTLNYIIIVLVVMLIIVMIYLSSTSSYAINFELNGGEPIHEVRSKYGEVVIVEAPVKTGYAFAGWYQDKDLTIGWDMDQETVFGNMILYAKWTPLKIQVSFDLNGGIIDKFDTLPAIEVTFHEPYGTLPIPSKDEQSFEGWQYNGVMMRADTIVSMNGEHTLKAIYK